ncbi:ATP-binding cassette domain-containing protein [Deinococcus hopiensis]|uniref:Peptide/nickel transport system ATP-binding protein n=1 Tax=Deinococcus hopiensis KR-140 TaxID=695939 RepID=A0A1W1UVS5_9DEIO|nr:ATP-binding cassette domain-containing protein [Deinococcus hopiensis]SMB85255.1 peptide/nickel transport system ATP-binding protein [Deinococcus hopiensis KR-140]
MTALLSARGLSREYPVSDGRRFFWSPPAVKRVVDNVDLDIQSAESVALIGESGSGKSTLVRMLLALEPWTAGQVSFDGRDVIPGPARTLHWLRRETGIVFQDPYASLDPRFTVQRIVREPLQALNVPEIPGHTHLDRVVNMLRQVGLDEHALHRYPHEFSGGQRQRIALARSLVHQPRLLIGDEPLSALDVTVRAQILELLRSLRLSLGFSLLIVSHDIGVVSHLCDRVLVFHNGRVVEHGQTATVFARPTHPYTQQLLGSVPRIPAFSFQGASL